MRWAVWVAARTSGQRPASACPFGSHAAPNARTQRKWNKQKEKENEKVKQQKIN
jgi:hypothetical protein